MLVELAKNLLVENGLHVFLKNEFALGGAGELAAIDTWVELWIEDELEYDIAKSIIAQMTSTECHEDWVCSNCKEANDVSFEQCWSCQTVRPS